MNNNEKFSKNLRTSEVIAQLTTNMSATFHPSRQ